MTTSGSGSVVPPAPATRKVTLLGLIAATYFMVAGGPYGLEDLVQSAGYLWAVVALLVVPLVWSLPTALMVSELSSAIPEEGGYYVWVRRGLGRFWGFQEAWLSLAASIFDMAIYPILFVTYLGYVGEYLAPAQNGLWQTLQGGKGTEAILVGIAMIAVCVLINLRPARSVGRSSVVLTVTLLAPFAVLTVMAVAGSPHAGQGGSPAREPDYMLAILFALWNYMGWDNSTTFAAEVDRPQRTYPLAMACAVMLVTLTYVLPVLAASQTAVRADEWKTGSWVALAASVGGAALAVAIAIGGMIFALGVFNALVLSYSRLPVVLAEDGFLPPVFTRRLRGGAPWVAVLVCAVAWALASQLGLKRVLALDVILYGLSLLLEFAALVALRIREPGLARPFRIPGGKSVAGLLGVFPAILIVLAIFDQARKCKPEEGDSISPAGALLLGASIAALGPLIYFAAHLLARRHAVPTNDSIP